MGQTVCFWPAAAFYLIRYQPKADLCLEDNNYPNRLTSRLATTSHVMPLGGTSAALAAVPCPSVACGDGR